MTDKLEGREIRLCTFHGSPYDYSFDPKEGEYAAHIEGAAAQKFAASVGIGDRKVRSINIPLSEKDKECIESDAETATERETLSIVVTYAEQDQAEHLSLPATIVIDALADR